MEKNIKYILNNGAEHDGQECEYTMCYSGDHKVKDKCLGWCDKISPPNNLSNNMKKNNEILAEFVGWPTHRNVISFKGRIEGKEPIKWKFDSDWGQLHDAWEKFRDLKFEGTAIQFSEYEGICMMIAGKITHGTIPEACEELAKGIIWYNSIKK